MVKCHVQLSCVMRICHSHIFHLQVNCILQERAEMLVDVIAIYNQIFSIFPHNIPRKEGAGMVRDMYISPLVEVIYICESLPI